MMWVRIDNGMVAEKTSIDPEGRFDETLVWVNVSSAPTKPSNGWAAIQSDGVWSFAAPTPPLVLVPQSVSAFQARAILHATPSKANAGKTMLDDVIALIAAPGADPVAALAWEYATALERSGKFVTLMSPTIGLSGADLDALFTAAAAIQG